MRFKAIIVWTDGTKDTYYYSNYQSAMDCVDLLKMIFGSRIWWGDVSLY